MQVGVHVIHNTFKFLFHLTNIINRYVAMAIGAKTTTADLSMLFAN